ncbi:hypothetical protein LAZ67_9001355 [Cordylochernes scorpioides]|uniref:Tc1-like transposase DDE domain-containing protein n=1 Tax=Cordylochernes scorpioides TaxID=51811 RepID=A0ABY6KTE9_9ARAC|nr:hypothetical protein LAZ67_9001355 [Cordylochernes scorpioides]
MLNSCVMHCHTGPAPGIMVWGGIGYHSRTPLVRLDGTLNSQRYIYEVLEPVVLPYLQGLPTIIFQQNNARPHVERIVQRFFVNRQIELLPWPARSPELSPIENMWSMVAQRLTQITSPATTPDQLWQRVEAAWSADRNQIKKTPEKFIPRFLTNEQKLCRLATCEDMLEMTRTDPELKDKIITGYETWVYGYDPETKHQSAEWRCQGELRPKKSRLLKSRNKVLLVAFLDKKGIFHHEYLPAGQTVIKDMYLGILRRLREAIRKKRPEKWTKCGWILHHDNARPHTAHLMTSFLAKNGTQILLQPPYFPDIAPNDFFLFHKLKAVLKGRHFDTRDDIIEKSPLALKSIPKEDYKNCFDNWEKRWR